MEQEATGAFCFAMYIDWSSNRDTRDGDVNIAGIRL